MATTNYVGSNAPSEADLSKYEKLIQSIIEFQRPWSVVLGGDQKSTMIRARVGSEKHLQLIHDLAKEKGLSIPALSLEGMQADIGVASSASRMETVLTRALEMAADTRYAAQSEAWQAFLGYYGVLSSMASRDPELANRLRPVVDFMASGKSKKPQP
jgi:hypothetical protein